MTMEPYHDIAFGPHSIEHQERRGSRDAYAAAGTVAPTQLGPEEIAFLTERDSFYLASIGANGWPYVQHKGGPSGFVHVTGPSRLQWAERPGNRQYVTMGNLDGDDRVSIIAVDYPNRRRMKLFGHARFDSGPSEAQLDALGVTSRAEGVVTVDVVAFDWNCPKFIVPRYTEDEVRAVVEPLRRRIEELEAALA
jgi:uncharacterized protein